MCAAILMKPIRVMAAAGLITAILVFAGCGGDGTLQVDVALSEWSITTSTAEIQESNLELSITNDGTQPHELVVIKSDLPPGMLPVQDGSIVLERVNVVDSVEPVQPGEAQELSLDISPGKYLLVCNLTQQTDAGPESHYQNGMVASLLVDPE